MRLDERSSSSVALVDDAGTRIAAADRLITEQQTMRNSIKALVAIAREGKSQRNGTGEDKVRGWSSRTNTIADGSKTRKRLRLRLTFQTARQR